MQTYILVGAGGTGTHLLPSLLAYLRNYHHNAATDYQVVIADGDSFSPENHTRQLFDASLALTNKAEAMVHTYPDHPLVAVTRYLGADDIPTMLHSGDCILICADNYSIRRLVVDHVKTLPDIVVVNGGNELYTGSVQLWVRRHNRNLTPPITYGHPEIAFLAEDDRAAMDCATIARLPHGEQTILANMTTAAHMLSALQRWHTQAWKHKGSGRGWTELHYDLNAGLVEHIDMRERRRWQRNPS